MDVECRNCKEVSLTNRNKHGKIETHQMIKQTDNALKNVFVRKDGLLEKKASAHEDSRQNRRTNSSDK